MSEPSPEAKQAAKYHWTEPDAYCHWLNGGSATIAVQHNKLIDTATAKAREELEQTRRERDLANEDYHHLQIDHDKLWDEAAKAREVIAGLSKRLYHQQPSAPTCTCGDDYRDTGCPVHGDMEDGPTAEELTGDIVSPLLLPQPTADVPPQGRDTADVEKLEWRLWPQGNNKVIVYQNNAIETIITPEALSSEQGERLRRHHNEALGQVSAPLVAALEQCESALAAFLPLHPAGQLARAVLTDTGEKEDLAGKTGN